MPLNDSKTIKIILIIILIPLFKVKLMKIIDELVVYSMFYFKDKILIVDISFLVM